MPFGPVRPRLAPAGGDADLAAILRRCAAGDLDGMQALRAWQGGRIGRTFARFVKDPELAEGALEAALADLYRDAVALEASGLPAEDWVFGRLRRLAQEAATGRPAEPPSGSARNGPAWRPARAVPTPKVAFLRPVVDTEEPSPEADRHRFPEVGGADAEAPARGVRGPAADEAAGEAVPSEIPTRVAPRRRSSIPRMSGDGDEAHVLPSPSRDGRPRRLLRTLIITVLAMTAATAGVLVGLRDSGQGSDIVVAPSPSPTVVVPSPAPAASPSATRRAASLTGTPPRTEPVPPPAPSRDAAAAGERAAIGGPAGVPAAGSSGPELAEPAPVPAPLPVPPVVARQEPPSAAPPATIAAPLPAYRPDAGPGATPAASGGGLRVFIHHAASDQTGAALARQLADQLRREGYAMVVVRQVRFRVTAPGVRYFFATDREAAARLLRTSARFVAPRAGRASGAPADFTHHQPKPRAGTLEVWIPGS